METIVFSSEVARERSNNGTVNNMDIKYTFEKITVACDKGLTSCIAFVEKENLDMVVRVLQNLGYIVSEPVMGKWYYHLEISW